jgi:hypothetical protein
MTTFKLKKSQPVRLRTVGLSESWLQDQIAKDPSLLGLGDLHLIQREKSQPSGGRIDFLMYDAEAETRYEVELMLGAVDESHIIRTIEYWDVERQRYPTLEHRAVIVAEEITARFFNVIRLLNRAVPMIAIQMSAFQIDEHVVLQFIKVLDTFDLGFEPEDDEGGERADRGYWERRAAGESLHVIDAVVSFVTSFWGEPRVTYNRGHIALGTSGYNFCWFHPRQVSSHCNIHVKIATDRRAALIEKLEGAGINAENHGRSEIRFNLAAKDLTEKRSVIEEVLRAAEEWSHR